MPSSAIAKIRSGRKKASLIAAGSLLLLSVGIVWNGLFHRPSDLVTMRIKGQSDPAKVFQLRKAVTPAEQEQGLSGSTHLADHTGMIFMYQYPANLCFWMKEMNYSIDMIWVDGAKKVVAIESNVSPKTYPEKSFCHEGRYVIEIPANAADKARIQKGSQLIF